MPKQLELTLYGLVSFLLCHLSDAQSISRKPQYWVEAGTYLSTAASNPFWIRSNQYGEVPLESQGITLRAQVRKEYDSLAGKKFSYGYGARAVLNAGSINQVLLTELYGKVRYGAFELYAGRRRELVGLADSVLSIGSYIWSGNALPIPKVQVSLPNYTPILKNGLIAVKGNFAHGWFGKGDWIQNYYLHQKSLYIRLGKPDWRFKFHGGFNHQVQWGGTLLYDRVDRGVKITRYGSDLESYLYVITSKTLYSDDFKVENGKASAEGGNRVGNHLGTFDIGLEYEDARTKWFIYRQSIYEDGSLFYLNNISDGLLGLSFKRKQATSGILRVVVEYLHTSSQGGSVSSGRATADELRGNDDYFNNGRYIDGWTYNGQTIGTPFIMPLRYTTGLPQNLAENRNLIVNNRVNAVTIGVQSRVKKFDLVTRISMSKNLGNYDVPLSFTQTSVQQHIAFPVQKYTLNAIVAYDNAGVLEQNLGLSLLVKRYF
ncbi:capsule assembly Wzi family protein [Larkinella sp. GY13]|uniref:capsule assembly Wzi family protein n=1 Tax=Larkinella sp. GY13 TaxID=3453720 RepID=UPI003EE8819D